MSGVTIASSATVPAVAPTMSSRWCLGGVGCSRSTRQPTTKSSAAIGALTKYSTRQPAAASISVDTWGAIAAASGPEADHSPTAVVRLDSGNNGSTRLSDAGRIAAPLIACSTRAMFNVHTVGAMAENTADSANSASPIWKMRLRPILSARRPASGRNAAVPIMNPAMPQPTSAADAPAKLSRIESSARLEAVLLKPTSTVPNEATVSARQARPDTASRTCEGAAGTRRSVAGTGRAAVADRTAEAGRVAVAGRGAVDRPFS